MSVVICRTLSATSLTTDTTMRRTCGVSDLGGGTFVPYEGDSMLTSKQKAAAARSNLPTYKRGGGRNDVDIPDKIRNTAEGLYPLVQSTVQTLTRLVLALVSCYQGENC